jgi:predicted nucleic acid-binding protein
LTELADTSAWVWSRRVEDPEVRGAFDSALVDGEVATCDMVRIELLSSARNPQDFVEIREELTTLPDCPIGKEQWERALSVYEQLSAREGSRQRSVKHPDLLIAAAAEAAGMTVLHYDEDYDRIAEVTGQPVRWLAPKGSLRWVRMTAGSRGPRGRDRVAAGAVPGGPPPRAEPLGSPLGEG